MPVDRARRDRRIGTVALDELDAVREGCACSR